MDEYYRRLNDDLEAITDYTEDSEIQKFFAGKTIFLTGATGFMGKCLVEKFLRSCPDLERIYVLIRSKKGSTLEERMDKFFDSALFGPLLKMYPDCKSKLQAVGGDLMCEDLGLSEKDLNTIFEETDFIIHNASNVKFTEKLKKALESNVFGTLRMIKLAKNCKKLKTFMYTSTAYSHCYKKCIKDEVYPSPATIGMLRDIFDGPDMTDREVKQLIGKFPNEYCFTKAIAEGLVDQMAKEVSFKCIITRPAIVTSSWREPLRSWVGNLNGPAVVMIGYALGILRTAYHLDCVTDFVPVDMSTNAAIVGIWDATENRARKTGSFVYNCGTSNTNPITLRKLHKFCLPDGERAPVPSIHTIWPYHITWTTCVYYFVILHILWHLIPAIIIDAYLWINGKKTQALSAHKKVTTNYKMLLYFVHGDWRIHITELNKAVDRLNSTDREMFFCDMRKLDWADYCISYWYGLRVYLLKDPMSTAPAAIKKFRRLKLLQNSLLFVMSLLILYAIVSYMKIY